LNTSAAVADLEFKVIEYIQRTLGYYRVSRQWKPIKCIERVEHRALT